MDCGFRWVAANRNGVSIAHLCGQPEAHQTVHVCHCGEFTSSGGEYSPPDQPVDVVAHARANMPVVDRVDVSAHGQVAHLPGRMLPNPPFVCGWKPTLSYQPMEGCPMCLHAAVAHVGVDACVVCILTRMTTPDWLRQQARIHGGKWPY